MKISVLIENTAINNSLTSEHGLSLLIEYKGKQLLLDAGSTEAFYHNAEKMGISLKEVELCVLSHGHYDHSGGFEIFLQNNEKAKVYMQKNAMQTYFSENGGMHEIGIPKNVLDYQNRFIQIDGEQKIAEDIYLIPHNTEGLEQIGKKSKLYQKVQDEIVPDNFSHEQSLVFETPKGLVIFNSCSHGGVANIIREVKQACNHQKIYAYIGGLHMKGKKNGEEICTFSEKEIDALCDVIKKEEISIVYTGHCTGSVGLRMMQERLGQTVQALTTGLQITI